MIGLAECSSGMIVAMDIWQIKFAMEIVEGYVGAQFSNGGRPTLF